MTCIEALHSPIARADRKPRIVREWGIFLDIEGIFNEIVGATQVGRAETKTDGGSPTGTGIHIKVSCVAGHRCPKSRRRLRPNLLGDEGWRIRRRVGILDVLRDRADVRRYILGKPPAERDAPTDFLFSVREVVCLGAKGIDLH